MLGLYHVKQISIKVMKTIEKIEKKGYNVTANFGWINGEQAIVSYTATKNNTRITKPNVTNLLKSC